MPNSIDLTNVSHPPKTDYVDLLDARQHARAQQLVASEGIRMDRAILKLGMVEEAALLRHIAKVAGWQYLETTEHIQIDRDIASQLGHAYLHQKAVAPLIGHDDALQVLTADPLDDGLSQEIAFHLGRPVTRLATTARNVQHVLAQLNDEAKSEAPSVDQAARDQRLYDDSQLDGPTIKFVNQILADAVAQGASDVHFASADHGLDVRFRIHGLLRRQTVNPSISASSVFARIKVIAGMNVAERRKPQDGRITEVIGGRVIDFRISALPTTLGESIVARILDPNALRLGWEKLGFPPEIEAQVKEILEKPNGLFLVTGPTGSGKTTTLYTALDHLRSEERKIITIEDPVEYQLPGIEQVQVNEAVGLTFAAALRAILRHDPNVIMVGEIRDRETAEIACRLAMVGRLVLSTLHTSSPDRAVARLVDLGVDEFIVRDVLRGVLGQRLTIRPNLEHDVTGFRKSGKKQYLSVRLAE